jgi:hypothetical protein
MDGRASTVTSILTIVSQDCASTVERVMIELVLTTVNVHLEKQVFDVTLTTHALATRARHQLFARHRQCLESLIVLAILVGVGTTAQ